jgi:hypothetical protein
MTLKGLPIGFEPSGKGFHDGIAALREFVIDLSFNRSDLCTQKLDVLRDLFL